MLWKLLGSDEKIKQALNRSGAGYDISPEAHHHVMPANNDTAVQSSASGQGTSRLWLEDWNEQDEARLKGGYFWEEQTG